MPYPKHACELKTEDSEAARNASWQSKVKAHIRSWSLVSASNFRSYLFLRTRGAIEKELAKQKASKYWYIVHPFSLLRLYWEIFMLCIYFIFVLFLSFRSGFLNSFMAAYKRVKNKSLRNVTIAVWIDAGLTTICFIDMLGFFITGYYNPETLETVMTPREIRSAYVFPDFAIDLSASFSADTLIVLFGGLELYTDISYPRFLCLELYNFYRLVRFRRAIPYFLQCAKVSLFSLLFFRLMFAFVIYVIIIHWTMSLSIIFPQIIEWKGLWDLDSKNDTTSWVQQSGFLNMHLKEQYVTSLMKALQNNIGANESAEGLFSVEDYLIALLSILFGRIYFLFFLLAILEVETASSALKEKLCVVLDQLKSFMKQKDLPPSLKKRMSRFYLYRFQAHYFSNRAMLARLTDSLRKEISMYTCQRLLHNTEVFQSVPKKVLVEFVQRMNREMYFPKDVIIQGNTFGECMYFICSGSVVVETLSEREICKLGDGDFFGEIALIAPDRRRIATVKSLTITEVYRLEYVDYKNIIDSYPDVYNRLEKFALERYKTTASVEGRNVSRRRP